MFNDVAVAARVLRRDGAIARAAVIDCDVHQGNGTAAIFRGDPAVFTFSLHGAKNFPFRKETSDLDVTFEDGAGDDEYLAALAAHLPLGPRRASRRHRVLSRRRRPVRGRSARPAEAHDRGAARARSPRVRRVPRARSAGRRRDERRLRPRHRRHRHHSHQHHPRSGRMLRSATCHAESASVRIRPAVRESVSVAFRL